MKLRWLLIPGLLLVSAAAVSYPTIKNLFYSDAPLPPPVELAVGYQVGTDNGEEVPCGVIPVDTCTRVRYIFYPTERTSHGIISLEEGYWVRYTKSLPLGQQGDNCVSGTDGSFLCFNSQQEEEICKPDVYGRMVCKKVKHK